MQSQSQSQSEVDVQPRQTKARKEKDRVSSSRSKQTKANPVDDKPKTTLLISDGGSGDDWLEAGTYPSDNFLDYLLTLSPTASTSTLSNVNINYQSNMAPSTIHTTTSSTASAPSNAFPADHIANLRPGSNIFNMSDDSPNHKILCLANVPLNASHKQIRRLPSARSNNLSVFNKLFYESFNFSKHDTVVVDGMFVGTSLVF